MNNPTGKYILTQERTYYTGNKLNEANFKVILEDIPQLTLEELNENYLDVFKKLPKKVYKETGQVTQYKLSRNENLTFLSFIEPINSNLYGTPMVYLECITPSQRKLVQSKKEQLIHIYKSNSHKFAELATLNLVNTYDDFTREMSTDDFYDKLNIDPFILDDLSFVLDKGTYCYFKPVYVYAFIKRGNRFYSQNIKDLDKFEEIEGVGHLGLEILKESEGKAVQNTIDTQIKDITTWATDASYDAITWEELQGKIDYYIKDKKWIK